MNAARRDFWLIASLAVLFVAIVVVGALWRVYDGGRHLFALGLERCRRMGSGQRRKP